MNLIQLNELYLNDLDSVVTYGNTQTKKFRGTHIFRKYVSEHTTIDGINLSEYTLLNSDKNVWIWSDLHIGHNNIIKYSQRPFNALEHMHDVLIDNFNSCVSKNDISIWVGDVGFGTDGFINSVLDRFNGYKILVLGNHDINKGKVRKLNFDEIHLTYKIDAIDLSLILSHYPIDNLSIDYINVHGHLHIGRELNSDQHINVNCEFHEYMPINLQDLLLIARMRKIAMEG